MLCCIIVCYIILQHIMFEIPPTSRQGGSTIPVCNNNNHKKKKRRQILIMMLIMIIIVVIVIVIVIVSLITILCMYVYIYIYYDSCLSSGWVHKDEFLARMRAMDCAQALG